MQETFIRKMQAHGVIKIPKTIREAYNLEGNPTLKITIERIDETTN